MAQEGHVGFTIKVDPIQLLDQFPTFDLFLAFGLAPVISMKKVSLMEHSNKKNNLLGIYALSLRLSFSHML